MSLPPHSATWMQALLGAALPEEQTATCDACVMCAAPGEPAPAGSVAFDPRTKCCTYLPTLHNFLVGRILADRDPAAAEGRATVEKRLDAGAAVTPLGLGKTRAFSLLYAHGRESVFGRAVSLRCPHYLEEGGRCGVWKHRESTCATWFCKHDRGATGAALWGRVQALVALVEREVARACVLEVGLGDGALAELFPARAPVMDALHPLDAHELDGGKDPARYARLWGAYAGREREFYRACAKVAGAISWKDVVARSGSEVRVHARLLQEELARYASRKAPRRLRLLPHRVESCSTETARLTTYSTNDAIELPRALADVLPQFDGRPIKDVLRELGESGVEIDRELLRTLVDFRLLEESEPAGAPAKTKR